MLHCQIQSKHKMCKGVQHNNVEIFHGRSIRVTLLKKSHIYAYTYSDKKCVSYFYVKYNNIFSHLLQVDCLQFFGVCTVAFCNVMHVTTNLVFVLSQVVGFCRH